MSSPVIRVENLGKRYRIGIDKPPAKTLGGKLRNVVASPFDWLATQMRPPTEEETLWALRDVSFEVNQGEVLGIIGRNGAGKSTLLKILSRITEPSTGYAEIHGRVGALLEVGTGMHPELTGRENIYQNGCILGMRKWEIDKKFDEIVDFSGIERFIDTPVKRYSSGQRVRLGFAIAAHLEPEILIVDEVLAVGDAEFQKRCIGKMQDVAGHGRTVLFVSHNMATMQVLCPNAMLLADGQVGFRGASETATEIYSKREDSKITRYEIEQDGFLLKRDDGFRIATTTSSDLQIDFQLLSSISIDKPCCGFLLKDSKGTTLAGMSSKFQDVTVAEAGKRWAVSAKIIRPQLNVGVFYLSVFFGSSNNDLVVFDEVLIVEVGKNDGFSGKALAPKSWGSFVFKPDWRFELLND